MTEKYPSESRIGGLGWGAIAAFVVAWDLLAPQTLSSFARQERARHPKIVLGAIAITAGHLLEVIPSQLDPFEQFLEHVPHRNALA